MSAALSFQRSGRELISPSRCPLPPDYKFQGKTQKFNPKGEEEWKFFHALPLFRGGEADQPAP
ncbi:hypothetical protein AY555_10145 (plasmid) [Haematospirillum jordaniae]|uniref:Uncharacterized protein n=1 Tax=Haematospirillum jordaniae TaxID=1549855 RepID=A0A143DG79_9PROT|nr:hypothetical protein AY555_10145 [Haematospirillum jordaniae]